MSGFIHDVRYAVRLLAHTPGLTLAALLALAVSIGANTAIFSVVDAVLFRPLPYRDADRLVTAWNTFPEKGFPQMPVVPSDFVEWQRQATVFEHLAAWQAVEVNLTGTGDPERLHAARASWNLFPLLGVRPALGRAFARAEDQSGGERVAILSDGLWKRRFGADRAIVGQQVSLDGNSYTVVGVMPAGFGFSLTWTQTGLATPPVDLWVPLALDPAQLNNGFELTVVGRVKPGTSVARAHEDLEAVCARIIAEVPDHKGIGVEVIGLHDVLTRDVRPAVVALAVAVGLVLLIACANVANLLLARASGRAREMALRAALGAGRVRLVRQLLTESLVLALCASAVGLALAFGATALLARYAPDALLRTGGVGVDLRVLGFTLGSSLVSAFLFGLAPVLHAGRLNLDTALRESARGGLEGRRHARVRDLLVVGEMALAVLLVVGSGLLLQSFLRVTSVDPGFRVEGVTMAKVSLPPSRYPDAARIGAFFDEVAGRLRAQPGVRAVGLASFAPLEQGREVFFTIEGKSVAGARQAPLAVSWAVDPGYFEVMGVRLRRGRLITDADTRGAEAVAVVDEALARRYWPGEDPIGRRIHEGYGGGNRPWIRIVGVVGSVRQYGQAVAIKPAMYLSFRQFPRRAMTVVARARTASAPMAAALRSVVRQVDPDQPIDAVRTVEEALAASVAPRRFSASLLASFASLALVLAAVGIYAVMSYAVARRTREIGIRKALGAQTWQIVGLVLGQGLALAGAGLAVGCLAAAWGTRLLSSQLYGVAPTDPVTFGASCLLLLAVALLACYVPARRATRVDAVTALRQE
jgi:putative ABC transport system permease protein